MWEGIKKQNETQKVCCCRRRWMGIKTRMELPRILVSVSTLHCPTGEYRPLNWPVTARVLTERYNNKPCYMAVSYRDWKLPNSRSWLAEIDLEWSLDFPILTGNVLRWKSCKLKCKNIDYFLLTTFIYGSTKKADEKKQRRGRANFRRIKFSSSPFARKMSASTNQLHDRIELF